MYQISLFEIQPKLDLTRFTSWNMASAGDGCERILLCLRVFSFFIFNSYNTAL